MFDVHKAKLPRQVNGRYRHTESSKRYQPYKNATTTRDYFLSHSGSEAEKRKYFYHDCRHRIFQFTDDTYAHMHFLFTYDLPAVDTFTGDELQMKA